MSTTWDVLTEAAKRFHGREMGKEVTEDDRRWLRERDLVVMYGASDDLVEIEGAIHDEWSAYGGKNILFSGGQTYQTQCDDDRCPHEKKLIERAIIVRALWGEGGVSWSFRTEVLHQTFDVMEDGEVFCRGIVFCKESVA